MKDKAEVLIVTGSSGMIGSALVHTLAEKYHVIEFDHDGYPFPPAEAECVWTSPAMTASVLQAPPR